MAVIRKISLQVFVYLHITNLTTKIHLLTTDLGLRLSVTLLLPTSVLSTDGFMTLGSVQTLLSGATIKE